MSGHKVATEIRARRPDIIVLFMSGYTDDILGEHGVLAPGTQLLEKPFAAKQLAARVRAILQPSTLRETKKDSPPA